MKTTFTSLALLFAALPAAAQQSAQFTMNLEGANIVERVSGQKYIVNSQLVPFAVKGVDGDALRFDGYSNFVKAALPAGVSTETMTFSVLLAPETYPMMNVNEAENTPTYATICGNLEDGGKKGFAFQLSSQGDVRFNYGSSYSGGYATSVYGAKKLPRGQWSRLTAVYDKGANAVTLYLNGEQIGTGRTNRMDLNPSTGTFWIGKDATDLKAWNMNINTFCGLIDDISIYNSAMTAEQVENLPNPSKGGAMASRPDFNYPASRYELPSFGGVGGGLWRPQFHGMPSGGWTNECHGMTYSDGKYHVFFQKNANGPYMARLHWGHISSEDLCSWTEEPIAVAPAEKYDIKGCWSGCVYSDPALTGGKPHILYTAVDNAKATICEASPVDETLVDWTKSDKNPIINGRPAGLSDDFRDPYFFSVGDRKYIIVGTSKNGFGACTLHENVAGKWTNDGKIFFQADNKTTQGTFWEMPNVTPLADGKYLFTCTPLGTGMGVRTICWVGTISPDGKFTPTSDMQYLEMGGVSRDGYGLLSPTIYQHDGKTLLLGIVPDKLPTDVNARMGWAHNYSLPRELSVAADGSLVQRPYAGLAAMRTQKAFSTTTTLEGTQSLDPVSGRHFEVIGDFTISPSSEGSGEVGFNFLKSNSGQATLTYNPAVGNLTLDLRSLSRTVNDNVYAGIYSATLPKKVGAGEHLKLHVFFDGSIADIFVNDTWAYSVRIYPNDANSVGVEAFATTPTATTISAWVLNATEHAPLEGISQPTVSLTPSTSSLYDLAGRQLSHQPTHGFCIAGGKKMLR